jgi:hypothetical protein
MITWRLHKVWDNGVRLREWCWMYSVGRFLHTCSAAQYSRITVYFYFSTCFFSYILYNQLYFFFLTWTLFILLEIYLFKIWTSIFIKWIYLHNFQSYAITKPVFFQLLPSLFSILLRQMFSKFYAISHIYSQISNTICILLFFLFILFLLILCLTKIKD